MPLAECDDGPVCLFGGYYGDTSYSDKEKQVDAELRDIWLTSNRPLLQADAAALIAQLDNVIHRCMDFVGAPDLDELMVALWEARAKARCLIST